MDGRGNAIANEKREKREEKSEVWGAECWLPKAGSEWRHIKWAVGLPQHPRTRLAKDPTCSS